MALNRSRTDGKRATWLRSIFETPPPFARANFRLTSVSQGSTPPFSLIVLEFASPCACGCAPHIQSTLSPRTEGTTTCAPTVDDDPTQISDGS